MTTTSDENIYKALMRARILGALETTRSAKGISHSGLKGRVREIIIGDLFRPLLPADVSIASGQIVECKGGRLSRQHDVILFDGAILPPFSFDSSAAIIPIEAVLYTIEVKSLLTKAELQKSHDSAQELNGFNYLAGTSFQGGKEVTHGVPRLNSVLFALESDLAEDIHNEPKRYREVYDGGPPHLKAICVAGRGYWYEHNGSWVAIRGDRSGDEVLAFIGGVMNTYKKISSVRGMQSIGQYLIERSSAGLITYPSGTKPTIATQCEKCSARAISWFNTEMPAKKEWTEGFVSPQACECGGRLIAPAGVYTLNNGLYELAG